MTAKKKRTARAAQKGNKRRDEELHAPAGRGGAAMGRTVGLPFGGSRARKRAGGKSKKTAR